MICPFCGSTNIQGPSRMTADWRTRESGSPVDRQWYLAREHAALMSCANCHEEFDALRWFGNEEAHTAVTTAA